MQLRGKAVIVTGGSQGIGAAISKRFAEDGAHVAIVFGHNEDRANALVQEIAGSGGRAIAIKADCSDVADIERMVAEAGRQLGRIDVLVNNAGTFKTVSITDTTEEIWDAQMDLNLKGTFFCARAVLPFFRKNGGGKIINLSSIAGVAAFPNCPAYCASKGGVSLLTRALATELARENINVNAIAPGNVATPINAHLRGPGNEAYMELMSSRTPTGRAFMDVEDIAGVALFLASDAAKGMHGAIVSVDDGWNA